MISRSRRLLVLGVLIVSLAGCTAGSQEEPTPTPVPSSSPSETPTLPTSSAPTVTASVPVEPVSRGDVVTDLAAPWSIAILDDGAALVSLRDSGERDADHNNAN